MDANDLNKLNRLYKDLLNYYFANGRPELDFDNKPFANFLDVLYPFVKENSCYDNDLFVTSVQWHLNNYDDEPKSMNGLIEELIEYVNTIFDINKDIHYILFPLQGSGLKEDVSFSNFNFLTKKDESTIISQIAEITNIDVASANDFLQHTKNSRSPDFLKDNIVLIKIENQTSNVSTTCTYIARQIIAYLNLIHTAHAQEDSIFRLAEDSNEDNYHVAILAKDTWRRRHSPVRHIPLQCKIDIDFIAKESFQKVFCDLYSVYVERLQTDELTDRFLNSLLLFNKGYTQRKIHKDESLSLLLYITALESLLAEGRNEKRLRLCATLSRIITIDGYSPSQLAVILDELYRKRNNFLHAGETPHFNYENNPLKILEQATSMLILKYFDVDSLLTLRDGEVRNNCWNRYIDNLFNSIIFSD